MYWFACGHCRFALRILNWHSSVYVLACAGPRHVVSTGGILCPVQVMKNQGVSASLTAVIVLVGYLKLSLLALLC